MRRNLHIVCGLKFRFNDLTQAQDSDVAMTHTTPRPETIYPVTKGQSYAKVGLANAIIVLQFGRFAAQDNTSRLQHVGMIGKV